MPTASEAGDDFDAVLNEIGDMIRIKFYTESGANANLDDDVVVAQSGTNIWASGIIQPFDKPTGDTEKKLMEEGQILLGDLRLYTNGSLDLSGDRVKIGLGSPTPTFEYQVIDPGVIQSPYIGLTPIYKKVYCRILNNGSFIGEA